MDSINHQGEIRRMSKDVGDRNATMREFKETEHRLHCACDQLEGLQRAVAKLEHRYQWARSKNYKPLQNSLKMQLSVMKSVLCMYYEYANRKAQKIQLLLDELNSPDSPVSSDTESEDNLHMMGAGSHFSPE